MDQLRSWYLRNWSSGRRLSFRLMETGVSSKCFWSFLRFQGLLVHQWRNFWIYFKAGGYEDPKYWHDEAWAWVNFIDNKAPLYWEKSCWDLEPITRKMGRKEHLDLAGSVAHVSFYEASAYVPIGKGCRLPYRIWMGVLISPIFLGQSLGMGLNFSLFCHIQAFKSSSRRL